MTARAKGRPSIDPRQVPLLMAVGPEHPAKALARRLVATLHEHLSGCCETVCGDRSADYFRKALRDTRPITVQRDIAQLAVRPEREPRAAVRAFALVLLGATEPRASESIEATAAAFVEESADVPAAVLRAGADGRYTDTEAAAIAREADDVELQLARLRGVLAARRTA